MIYTRRKPVEWEAAGTADSSVCRRSDRAGCSRDCRCEPAHRPNVLPPTAPGNRQQAASYDLSGAVEADESDFGGVRKGTRPRAAAGKVPVFGLLKWGGKVFTAIIPNARSRTLRPIIREPVPPGSIVYTDSFTAYGV
jgi:hypothetical protein